jgi:phosphoadenosine phosphosulfate reductase
MNSGPHTIDIDEANAELARLPAPARIRWAANLFGTKMSLLASMQKTSSVLIHMFADAGLDNEVLFVDTGFHFHETLNTRDELIRRYQTNLVTLYPDLTPAQQEAKYDLKLYNYVDGQPDCCRMRKEEPFLDHVRNQGQKLVILGLRKSEGGNRSDLAPIAPDPRYGGFVLHPLLEWDEQDVDQYIDKHAIPVNPLHAEQYPSIGCQVCTTPVTLGEEPRAGRWRHLREGEDGPQYCGLNFSDGGGI